jgi:hypothetical protein
MQHLTPFGRRLGLRASASPGRLRRGAVLLKASMCLFFMLLLGAALVSISLRALHQTRRTSEHLLAFNLAESGVDRAVRWLKDQPYPPAGTAAFDPFGGEQELGEGIYGVTITPDPNNSGAVLKQYFVEAWGAIHGRTETVELVVKQQSFGAYAYFTDREVSSISGGASGSSAPTASGAARTATTPAAATSRSTGAEEGPFSSSS